jgi:hypothetical protein
MLAQAGREFREESQKKDDRITKLRRERKIMENKSDSAMFKAGDCLERVRTCEASWRQMRKKYARECSSL